MSRNVWLRLLPGDRGRSASLWAEERYWDAVVLRQPTPPDPIDASLAATIQRVHGLDDAPLPDPAFAARLERALLQGRLPAPAAPVAATPSTARPEPGNASSPADRPMKTRRYFLMNVAATAALLAIVLASIVVTLLVGPLASRDRVAPIVLGPGITAQTLLLQARFETFSDGILSASIDRWVLQPGAETVMGSQESGGEGPSAYRIESGTLTVQPDGPIFITRGGTTEPTAVAADAQIALQTGDRGFAPVGVLSLWRNTGLTPVRILEAKVKKGDVTVGGEGVLDYSVITESPFAKPDHPIVMSVYYMTLQPGAALTADTVPGLEMLKVEAGRLVAVDVDSAGHPLPPVVIGEATRLLRAFPPGRVFRSGNDEPVSLLLVVIANANPLGVGG